MRESVAARFAGTDYVMGPRAVYAVRAWRCRPLVFWRCSMPLVRGSLTTGRVGRRLHAKTRNTSKRSHNHKPSQPSCCTCSWDLSVQILHLKILFLQTQTAQVNHCVATRKANKRTSKPANKNSNKQTIKPIEQPTHQPTLNRRASFRLFLFVLRSWLGPSASAPT